MIPTEYTSPRHTIKTLAYPEATRADFEALIGAENVNEVPDGIQIRNCEQEWVTLRYGWVAAVRDGGSWHVMSPGFLKNFYQINRGENR